MATRCWRTARPPNVTTADLAMEGEPHRTARKRASAWVLSVTAFAVLYHPRSTEGTRATRNRVCNRVQGLNRTTALGTLKAEVLIPDQVRMRQLMPGVGQCELVVGRSRCKIWALTAKGCGFIPSVRPPKGELRTVAKGAKTMIDAACSATVR